MFQDAKRVHHGHITVFVSGATLGNREIFWHLTVTFYLGITGNLFHIFVYFQGRTFIIAGYSQQRYHAVNMKV